MKSERSWGRLDMKLNDYLVGVVDNRGKNPKHYYENSIYPVLDNYLIKNELYPNMSECKRYIDQDTFDSFLRGYTFKGMVVMTLVGNGIGNVTTIPSDDVVIIQNTIGFVPNTTILDNRYLYYFFLSNIDYIKKFDRGSGQPSIKKTDILSFEVTFPKLYVQKRISEVLSSLDKKISINTAINENLEQQAQAIFKSWFVDFEPFGGVKPDDWKSANLLDIADYLNGLAMQKYRPVNDEVGLPVLKIKELRQGFCDDNSELCSPNIKGDYIVQDGDVIFSWSGSLLVDFWCGGKCGLNQHLFKVSSKSFDKWFYYIWTKYHLNRFIAIAADMATTMGHIKRSELEKSLVLIPNETDYVEIGNLLKPIYETIIINRIENQRLATLRDTLLPKLMNGEIDVSQVQI